MFHFSRLVPAVSWLIIRFRFNQEERILDPRFYFRFPRSVIRGLNRGFWNTTYVFFRRGFNKKANDIAMTARQLAVKRRRGRGVRWSDLWTMRLPLVVVNWWRLKLKVRMRFYLLRRNLNCKSCVLASCGSVYDHFSSFFSPIERRQILNVIIGDISVFQARMFWRFDFSHNVLGTNEIILELSSYILTNF